MVVSTNYSAEVYHEVKNILHREYKRKTNIIALLEDLLREEREYEKCVKSNKTRTKEE